MSDQSIIEAKQQRSQTTQAKLLDALHFSLSTKFFEQISIKELAEHANVSVGTFYRRFKNKESLLPLLYQDFGRDLEHWVSLMESIGCETLKQQVESLCIETYAFLNSRKSVFRTLHLNARLHSHIIGSDKQVDRQIVYQRLVDLLIQFKDNSGDTIGVKENDSQLEEKAGVVIYTLINTLLDKVIYPKLTPATASDLEGEAFVNELSKMLFLYLKSDQC
jgi:AcrR family transcriptional regulator